MTPIVTYATPSSPTPMPVDIKYGPKIYVPPRTTPTLIQRPATGVIDACSYVGSIITLDADGTIGRDHRTFSSSIHIEQLAVFEGRLLGLEKGSGTLFMLDNESIDNPEWTWQTCYGVPTKILNVSCTLDETHCLIQTEIFSGLLYSKGQGLELNFIGPLHTQGLRRYGRTKDTWIDLSDGFGYASTGVLYHDILDAVITYYGDVVTLDQDKAERYWGVRLVNWEPKFITLPE